ncbi:MAG: hypothetical protein M0P37_04335 [Synergistaceae bacterium]|jgi:hypothetical protein|nr:hypothetical protein [Synergistaceae bacterium]
MGYGDTARIKHLANVTYSDLGLADEETLEMFISDLNDQASEIVDDYCGRDFGLHGTETAPVVAKLNGNGRRTIRLPGFPVVSVVSVSVDGTILTEGKEYDVILESGILERIDRGIWMPGRRNIVVKYVYGYESPPKSIARIVEGMVVAALVATKKRVSVGAVSSISMDGYSVSYDRITGNLDLTDEWTQILDRYRVVGSA